MGEDGFSYVMRFGAGGLRLYNAGVWSFSICLDNTQGRPQLVCTFWRWEWWIGWRLHRVEDEGPPF